MPSELTLSIDWQNLVVLAFVAAAGIYLARQAWATIARKKSGACGSCGNCASNATASEKQLVQLGAPGSSTQETSL
jgi:hypothetical protein